VSILAASEAKADSTAYVGPEERKRVGCLPCRA